MAVENLASRGHGLVAIVDPEESDPRGFVPARDVHTAVPLWGHPHSRFQSELLFRVCWVGSQKLFQELEESAVC